MKIFDSGIKNLLTRIAEEDDEKAFELLFHTYLKRLLHFTQYITKSKELSEEISLDVFSIIWQQRDRLPGIHNFESYIFTSAKNISLNYLDKASRKPAVSIETLNSDIFRFPDTPEEQLISKEKFEAIRKAISNLPPKCGLIFDMIFINGLKYKDVASILGISLKTVEAQMAIAMKKITIELKRSHLF